MKKSKNALLIFIISAVLFVALTLPFRFWLAAANVTQMRPTTALTPILGMIFGLPASAGCAAGYLISDAVCGYEISYSLIGALQQVLYGMVPFIMWKKMNKEHDGNEFRLDSVSRMLKLMAVMLVDAVMIVLCTGILNHAYAVMDFLSMENLYLFLNSFDSGLLFGCPILIAGHFLQRSLELRDKEDGKKEKVFTFSLNERMILNTIVVGVGISLLIGVAIYATNQLEQNTGAVGMWGSMFLFQTLAFNLYLILAIGMMWYTEKKIANPIEDIACIAERYYEEDSNEKKRDIMLETCKKYTADTTEIGNLARSYIAMLDDMRRYVENLKTVTAERERINSELSLAADIQANMLPCIFPAFPEHDEFDIYATMTPAKEVGGDFYDLFMVDATHVAIVIGDVSGKGVPAALFMVIAKTLIKNYAQMGLEADVVYTTVNRILCESNEAGLFVTSWMGILDITDGTLSYVNAGHNPPLLKQGDGDFTYLKCKPGFVLAGLDTMKYKKNELKLQPGDRLYLYTDGVTEATNAKEELYGEERLENYMNQHKSESVEDVLHGLKEDIDGFVAEAPQFDDITMLMLDFQKFKK